MEIREYRVHIAEEVVDFAFDFHDDAVKVGKIEEAATPTRVVRCSFSTSFLGGIVKVWPTVKPLGEGQSCPIPLVLEVEAVEEGVVSEEHGFKLVQVGDDVVQWIVCAVTVSRKASTAVMDTVEGVAVGVKRWRLQG